MKLYYSPTSPFTRKVHIVLIEAGLMDRVELVHADGWDPNAPLNQINPLSQVPTLVLADGEVIYDSDVICDYLDGLHYVTPFIPTEQPARRSVLRMQALANGIMAASIAVFVERKRDPEMQSADWISFQQAAIGRGLDSLEENIDLSIPFDLGSISAVCALGHLDFRDTFGDWRTGRDTLTSWYAHLQERASVKQTVPHLP